jgi:hypothetical protein
MITRYVRCINDACVAYGIKRGDVCTVLQEHNAGSNYNSYTFDKHYGGHNVFSGDGFFEPIVCPCAVKNCLKHRPQSP